MRLDWLEDMLAIVEADSMSEAAKVRLLTQPAFSRRVKTLEELLGIQIIDRTHRPARPSNVLLEHESRIRSLADGLKILIADLKREGAHGSNRIVIAGQHAITASHAAEIVKSLATTRKIRVRLRSANGEECYAMLLTRQADLILTYRMAGEKPNGNADFTEELVVGNEELIPVFSASAAQPATRAAQGGELPVITYPADVLLGKIFNTHILPKINPHIVIVPVAETALTLAALQLSKAAVGVAWVPASLAVTEIALKNMIDLRDTLPVAKMNLVATRLLRAKSQLERDIWEILVDGVHREVNYAPVAGPV
jgi:LysR family transcriptional regulator, hypochlorite-specific transcription factor HypT